MFCLFLFVHMQKLFLAKLRVKTTTHTRAEKNLNSSLSIRQAALTCCLPRTTCPARKSSCPDSQTGFSCPAHTIMHHLTTTSCGSSQPRSEHHNNLYLHEGIGKEFNHNYVLCTSWLESHNEAYMTTACIIIYMGLVLSFHHMY